MPARRRRSSFPPLDSEGRGTSEAGGGDSLSIERGRALRRQMTPPERRLWRVLKGRPGGLKFRRQHPAGPYILDFFCAERRFAIEIDGEGHNRGDRPNRDAIRDAWLISNGVEVCRIPATDVLGDINSLVEHIVHLASARTPLHRPAGGPPPLSGEDL